MATCDVCEKTGEVEAIELQWNDAGQSLCGECRSRCNPHDLALWEEGR